MNLNSLKHFIFIKNLNILLILNSLLTFQPTFENITKNPLFLILKAIIINSVAFPVYFPNDCYLKFYFFLLVNKPLTVIHISPVYVSKFPPSLAMRTVFDNLLKQVCIKFKSIDIFNADIFTSFASLN